MASFDASLTPIITATFDVVIASGASLSAATPDLRGLTPVAINNPASTEGAVFTFQIAYDDALTTFGNLYYDNTGTNTELSIATTAGQITSLDPHTPKFFGARSIKVRTGTAASGTNQSGADATLTVVCRYLG